MKNLGAFLPMRYFLLLLLVVLGCDASTPSDPSNANNGSGEPECGIDADCLVDDKLPLMFLNDDNVYCDDGICRECKQHSDCPTDYACSANIRCTETNAPLCGATEDCLGGLPTTNLACIDERCRNCDVHSDCGSNDDWRCYGGECFTEAAMDAACWDDSCPFEECALLDNERLICS